MRRKQRPRQRDSGSEIVGSLCSDTHPGAYSGQDAYTGRLIATEICPTLRAGGNLTGGHRPPGTDVDTCDSLIISAHMGVILLALTCQLPLARKQEHEWILSQKLL